MAPGLYSIKLIRQFEIDPKIEYQIIINPDSLHKPKLIIGNLPNNVSLRALKSRGLIPHSMMLVDSRKLLFGGSELSDDDKLEFEPILITELSRIQKYKKRFESLWNSIDEAKNSDILKKHSSALQKNAISVSAYEYDNQYVASRKSKIFHKHDSPVIKRIKPRNRIYFSSWQEAVKSGRQPAKKMTN
tara:strand:+ start:204 stop:767 length:564 start_codon:yes stop_codon:yes gene_type:complete